MTKEEIINHLKRAYLPENLECDGAFCDGCWKDVVRQSIKMIEEYDQQTTEKNSEIERLKAELVKTIETAKAISVTQRQHIERLQNELNELKEKHKKDVMKAYKDAQIMAFSSNPVEVWTTDEQYYKQKFESND